MKAKAVLTKITLTNYYQFLKLRQKGLSAEEIADKMRGISLPNIQYTLHAIEQTGTTEYTIVQGWKQSHHNHFADKAKRAKPETSAQMDLFAPTQSILLPPSVPDPDTPCAELTAGQMRDLILWQRYLELKKYFNQ